MTVCLVMAASAAGSATDGRWKDDGNGGCVFDETDSGPDQCSPTIGRWKDDGNGGCFFDATESGPNQCTPPLPTEPGPSATLEVAAGEPPVGRSDESGAAAKQNAEIAPHHRIAGDNR
jgi:hypothetical protein